MEVLTEPKLNLADYGYNILQIETIAKCNMACTFCHYPFKQDKFSEMPTEMVYKLLDEVDAGSGGFKYVSFNQLNEPLMDKRIFDFIRHARKNGLKSLIITNGLLLGKENIAQQLVEARPDFIKLSIQGLDKKNIKKMRGINFDVDKYFENIFAFLSRARQANLTVTVDVGCNFYKPGELFLKNLLGMTVGDPSVPDNLNQMTDDVITFLNDLKKADPTFNYDMKDFTQTSKNYFMQRPIALSDTIMLKVKQFWYGHKLSKYQPAKQKFSCNTSILAVLSDGHVVPCCITYDHDLSLGTVKNQSLKDVLDKNADFFKNLRAYTNEGKKEMCKRCFGQPTKRGVWFKWAITRANEIVRGTK